MAEALPKLRWNSLSSVSHTTTTRLSPPHRLPFHHRRQPPATTSPARTRCKAVEIGTPAPPATATAKTKKNKYEIENLTIWLLKQEQAGHIDAELTIVLSSISLACKQIASLLQRSSIINLTGAHGTINIQGEDQKKLDVIANEVSSLPISQSRSILFRIMFFRISSSSRFQLFCSCLRSSGRTGIIASEEEDAPVAVEETYSGNYIVVFDPIDGSANIDTSLTTGSIFGTYAPDRQCLFDLDDDSAVNFANPDCEFIYLVSYII